MALLSRRNLTRALRRHWIKAVSVAAAATALALLALRFLPPQHFSEARLRLSAAGGDAAELTHLLQLERQAVIQQLGSPEQLSRLADKLPGIRALEKQAAMQVLQRQLRIAAATEPADIVVRGTSDRPELATHIVATLVENFLEEYSRERSVPAAEPPPAAPTPASDERAVLEDAWKQAAQRLEKAEQSHGELSLAGQRKLIEGQLAEVQLQLLRELSQHEVQERQLAEQLTPQHPQLMAIRQTIDELSRQIHQADRREQSPQDAPAENLIPGEVGILCQRRQELRRELAALNEQQQRVAAAASDVQLAQSRLAAYSEKRPPHASAEPSPPARFTLTLVQPASQPQQSGISPRLVIAGAVLLGCAGGVGIALVCHRENPLLTTCGDVERLLALPVTGPIPTQVQPLDMAV